MASRKAIVLGSSGLLEQLQVGDTLAGSSELSIFTLTNQTGSPLAPGAPVYSSSSTHCDRAQANASGTASVIGLAAEAIAGSAAGEVQSDGVLPLTTGEWDVITGGSGGLTAGQNYWLDPSTGGMLTTTAPTTTGQYNVLVGKGLSATEMLIRPRDPILL